MCMKHLEQKQYLVGEGRSEMFHASLKNKLMGVKWVSNQVLFEGLQ